MKNGGVEWNQRHSPLFSVGRSVVVRVATAMTASHATAKAKQILVVDELQASIPQDPETRLSMIG